MAAADPSRFRPKLRVPSLVGHFPGSVTYDKVDNEMRGTPEAVQQISWHLPTTEENPGKPQLGNRREPRDGGWGA